MSSFDPQNIPQEVLDLIAKPPNRIKPGATSSVPEGISPQQIRRIYEIEPLIRSGITGKGQSVAIVVANHNPTAQYDLEVFSNQFGLPRPNLNVIFATGTQPPTIDPEWTFETAIDTQWVHALAPDATIYLVEAASAHFLDLLFAVDVASNIPGVRVVSMSWFIPEVSFEGIFDFHFQHPGIVYVAASGDSGGLTVYPSASPFVLSVGGTSLVFNSKGKFLGETGWSGSGGGPSQFEPEPNYQIGFVPGTGGTRGTPDVSLNADPATGVSVFTSSPTPAGVTGWLTAGGTSVSAPCWAAIIALADQIRKVPLTDGHQELYNLAKGSQYARNYNDITVGTAGSFSCIPGWDFVTGLGTPRANHLVRALGRDHDPDNDESEDFEESSSEDESSSDHGHHQHHNRDESSSD
ncbi:S53 family peptidase [Neobacillus drentensis]|uniref:S53 family peptidase n=1 Tax=Neobacillus drentensis TaxID=220684 RepID=UPI002865EF42|nr:S53 family peptidase [Neobacillus drentensis]MDR7240869.1 subtilase family serine protease [Neobacillus drentensis]